MGTRKPAHAIYEILLSRIPVPPERGLLVDDRVPNLDAAASVGLATVLFDPKGEKRSGSHPAIGHLQQLLDL